MVLIREALARRLRQNGSVESTIDPDADLMEYGLIDSMGLLDIIIDVEERCDARFDAEGMDFESGLTIRRLAAAFTIPA
jgi:acyl carrier protein